MYMPKGILKKRVRKKDFILTLENLKDEKLGVTKSFSGYIRLFCTDYEDSHDDFYLLIHKGTIVAAEKVEIERKIRTIKDTVLDEFKKEYKECEISIFGLGSREMEVAKEINEDCELEEKILFLSAIDREELLKRIKTDVDMEKVLSKFEGFEEKINPKKIKTTLIKKLEKDHGYSCEESLIFAGKTLKGTINIYPTEEVSNIVIRDRVNKTIRTVLPSTVKNKVHVEIKEKREQEKTKRNGVTKSHIRRLIDAIKRL